VTNINSGVLPDLQWASQPGASCLRASFPGTGVLDVGGGTGPSAALLSFAGARAVPRVRSKVAFVAPTTPKPVAAVQLGQTNIHNYMTRVHAAGEGASGPPPRPPKREPV